MINLTVSFCVFIYKKNFFLINLFLRNQFNIQSSQYQTYEKVCLVNKLQIVLLSDKQWPQSNDWQLLYINLF